jgi:hypothetical protein
MWEVVVKTPLLPPPSIAATADDAGIGAVCLIPLLPPLTTTAITAIDNRHHYCHTVNNDNHQKPAVIVCHQQQQWRSLVDGSGGQWRPRQWWSLSTAVVVDGGSNEMEGQ